MRDARRKVAQVFAQLLKDRFDRLEAVHDACSALCSEERSSDTDVASDIEHHVPLAHLYPVLQISAGFEDFGQHV